MMNSTNNLSRLRVRNLRYINSLGLCVGGMLAFSIIPALLLFIRNFQVEALPKLLVVGGVIGLVLSIAYRFLQKRFSAGILTTVFILAFCIYYYLIFYFISVNADKQLFINIAFAGLFPTSTILLSLYQDMSYLVFNVKGHKSYAVQLSIGLVLSVVLCAASFPFILEYTFLETRHLLFLAVVIGLLGFIITWVISKEIEHVGQLQFSAMYINYKHKYLNLFKNKYFLFLSLFVFALTISLWFIDVLFLHSVVESDKSLKEVYSFISYGFIAIGLLSMIFTSIANKGIIKRYGLKVSLMFIPVIIVLFTISALVVGYFYGFSKESLSFIRFFIIIVFLAVLVKGLKMGFQNVLFKNYLSPIEGTLRFDIQTLLTGYIPYVATICTGIILQLTVTISTYESWSRLIDRADSQSSFSIITGIVVILFAVVWMVAIHLMYDKYKNLLETSLSEKSGLVQHDEALNQSFLNQLKKEIPDSPFHIALYKLNLLEVMDPVAYRKQLVQLTDHRDEGIQEIALYGIARYDLLESLQKLQSVKSWKYFTALRNVRFIREIELQLESAVRRLEDVKFVHQLSSSKLKRERKYGALLTPYLDDKEKKEVLTRLLGDPDAEIIHNAIIAASGVTDTELLNGLIVRLSDQKHSNTVVSSVSNGDDSVLEPLETAFQLNKHDQATQQRIVNILGRIASENAVEWLLDKLNYPNQNIVSSALDALSKSGFTVNDDRKRLQVRAELEEVGEAMVWNMAVYLDVESYGYDRILSKALVNEVKDNYDTIFRLLSLIHDPKSVSLVKENIDSSSEEEAEFALDLLEVLIADELKLYLIPLFKRNTYEEKVAELKHIFPTEPMEKREVLVSIVQRDYKWINSWTKACALKELADLGYKENYTIMASNLVNPDPILRETAAQALLLNFPEEFKELEKRYKEKGRFRYVYETMIIVKRQNESERDGLPRLKFKIISFLSSISELAGVSGLVISEIAKRTNHVVVQQGKQVFGGNVKQVDVFFIYSGSIRVQLGADRETKQYQKHDMFHNFDLALYKEEELKVIAEEDSVILKIDHTIFHELLTFYEEIPRAMVQYYEQEEYSNKESKLEVSQAV